MMRSGQKTSQSALRLGRILFSLRYLAAVASLFLALGSVFLIGAAGYQVISAMTTFWNNGMVKTLSVKLVSGVDIFFISLTLLILSLGIFDLFVLGENGHEDGEVNTPKWLAFNSIDDLKDVLAKLIVVILTVSFFEILLEHTALIDQAWELLVVPAGILMIAGAWRLMK